MFKINILRKSKPIEVKFYTGNRNAYELYPVAKATNYLPKWLTSGEPVDKRFAPTHCQGMRGLFHSAIALPMWSDFWVEHHPDPASPKCMVKYEFSNESKSLMVDQKGHPLDIPSKILYKCFSPWLVYAEEDLNATAVENMFEPRDLPFEIMSGFENLHYQHATHFFFYLPNGELRTGLRAGDVPVLIVPKTEREVKVTSVFDPEMAQRLTDRFNRNPHFTTKYGRTVARLKQVAGMKGINRIDNTEK